jgi:hypothetical protein
MARPLGLSSTRTTFDLPAAMRKRALPSDAAA